MKTRSFKIAILIPFLILLFCGFTIDESSSLKSLTKPYITTYECTAARLGNENIMEKYEYIKITFLNDKELEVSLKRKNYKKKSYVCEYHYDEKTSRFNAELGILGFRFKQDAKIENGKFTLCMPILGRTLLMNFQS
ncbi:MAG: hypothetical protein ACI4MB_05645 [Candidatus Coproplasma sp.]